MGRKKGEKKEGKKNSVFWGGGTVLTSMSQTVMLDGESRMA